VEGKDAVAQRDRHSADQGDQPDDGPGLAGDRRGSGGASLLGAAPECEDHDLGDDRDDFHGREEQRPAEQGHTQLPRRGRDRRGTVHSEHNDQRGEPGDGGHRHGQSQVGCGERSRAPADGGERRGQQPTQGGRAAQQPADEDQHDRLEGPQAHDDAQVGRGDQVAAQQVARGEPAVSDRRRLEGEGETDDEDQGKRPGAQAQAARAPGPRQTPGGDSGAQGSEQDQRDERHPAGRSWRRWASSAAR